MRPEYTHPFRTISLNATCLLHATNPARSRLAAAFNDVGFSPALLLTAHAFEAFRSLSVQIFLCQTDELFGPSQSHDYVLWFGLRLPR